MIHHVEGNCRVYDLTERILPRDLGMQEINSGECKVFMLKKYVKAAGFGDIRDICRFGFWQTNSQERKKAMADMMHEGIVEPVEVQGIKNTFYMPPEESSMLEPDPDLCDEVLLLAPLDKLIGNRKLISEVFGFDYAWEIYNIPAKRIFGCYVMPILHGDRFIGRLDPKLDRANKKMTINALYLEGGKIDG